MRGLLRQDRKDILTAIGFVWKVSSRKGELILEDDSDEHAVWCFRFRELVEFQKNHGVFPKTCVGGNNTGSLVEWATEQRKLLATGKMEELKAQRLAAIGFCSDNESQMWEINYQLLLKAGYNSIYSLKDPGLSHWVICQRYLHRKGTLSTQRKMKLFEVAGFSWDSSPLNLPKPEPKHVVKEKERRKKDLKGKRQTKPTMVVKKETNTQQKAAMVEASRPDSPATTVASESSEGEGALGLLAMASHKMN